MSHWRLNGYLLAAALVSSATTALADADWNRVMMAARTAATEGDYRDAEQRLTAALRRAQTPGEGDIGGPPARCLT